MALVSALIATPVTGAFMDPPQTPRERCDPVEYAELADMDRPQLEAAYCQTLTLAAQRDREASVAGNMGKKATGGAWYARQEASERFAARCREQGERMRGIFTRRFSRDPSCSAQPPPK